MRDDGHAGLIRDGSRAPPAPGGAVARERALSRSVSLTSPRWAKGGTLNRSVSAWLFHSRRDTREAGRLRPLPRFDPRHSDPGRRWRKTSGSHSGRPAGRPRCARRPAALGRLNPSLSLKVLTVQRASSYTAHQEGNHQPSRGDPDVSGTRSGIGRYRQRPSP